MRTIKTVDVPIGGKLVVYREQISSHEIARADSDSDLKRVIRRNIANQIALYMLDNNLIEINLRDDLNTFTKEIVARVCIVPDDKIRIVRTMI